MIEKMTHVRNPLSVVAIFAGFAEVAGTAVLPFLDTHTQHIYVWFLMAFPTLLVGLFFGTLNWNHTVLYAPSDYKDDNTFASFVRASAVAVQFKASQEVAEAVLEDVRDQATGAEANVDIPASASSTADDPTLPFTSVRRYGNNSTKHRAEMAASLAINRLSRERNLEYVQNVSLPGHEGLIFDAIALSGKRSGMTVVEVKYTVRGSYPSTSIVQVFERIESAAKSLNQRLISSLDFIFILVIGDETSEGARQDLLNRATDISRRYPFTSEVLIYRYNELIEQ